MPLSLSNFDDSNIERGMGQRWRESSSSSSSADRVRLLEREVEGPGTVEVCNKALE